MRNAMDGDEGVSSRFFLAMNITEKLALAQQGCSGGIKQEVTDEKDEGGHSSKHSSGRKRGRSFMDDFNANVISLLDEDHEDPEFNDTIKISWPVVL